jgi:hypothetical protein
LASGQVKIDRGIQVKWGVKIGYGFEDYLTKSPCPCQ